MMGKRKIVNSVLLHVVLAVLAVIWITPIVWLIVTSFSGYDGMNTSRFFPETWSIRNYTRMLFEPDTVSQFPIWFKNTLVIAIFVCLISTSFVLMVSYAMSCMRFKGRKALMNIAVMLQLFPGFLSMIAIYFILKSVNLTNSHIGMILVYSGASGLGYLVAKGFFDTIPIAIDEAALLDGCTRWQIFTKITLPLSKPIIIYTVLTSFMGPWLDFIFAKVICRANSDQYTIAIGLWKMLEKEYIDSWYTSFAAGAVLISIPIAILFLCMQRFYVDGVSGAVKG
ncbi:MAG: sugar ABC transporter permease [Roseburia sp.]